MKFLYTLCFLTLVQISCSEKISSDLAGNEFPQFSGIYPHLAYYNNEGECGTGAVVPWAGRLWVITYGPHLPDGSSDKLYEITPELKQIVRKESIGGTPANRMIHQESDQLFIGPYVIDSKGLVRVIPYSNMPGRHTGNARHLSNPSNKIYYATMEEGFYEVDVNTLEIKTLFTDGNKLRKEGEVHQFGPLLPGAHGKGLYSGQGVLVYSNNGETTPEALKHFDIESGALAEWDGNEWQIVRRNQFVEVTGPGGIYGNANPETDPIWATGWDHKSVILGVRAQGSWSFFRLPKASHTYDGAHGWNTEWPRIRDIGTKENADYLMTMHGMFWKFPQGFTSENSAGIRPRSAYLKVIGDFTRWSDQLVFGCDDSAQKEFLNKRKVKGGIEGPGQSNSNLWFTSVDTPDNLGPGTASGAVWLNEEVKANEYSEPFLFAGWPKRIAWISNHGKSEVKFTFEVDKIGDGNWTVLRSDVVKQGQSARIQFSDSESGEWVRVCANNSTKATVQFTYTDEDNRSSTPDIIFNGLALNDENKALGGLLYGLGNDRRALGVSARSADGSDAGYYELDGQMNLVKKDDSETQQFIEDKFAIPENVISVEESSVLIIDDSGRRWRLPKGSNKFDGLTNNAQMRICREVATERDLLNCHGTFYELPAENADGFAKIRPIASHNFRIHDYASYRGMLIMTGINPEQANDNPHIVKSEDGKAALWAGVIDDLWKMGKPVGEGGPWKNKVIEANVPSDPYLIGFYDKKKVSISHNQSTNVKFTIEVNP
ncbi:MAG: hypothetical protein KAQ79_19795, partial [Cyclobacteriaceae bacterium]|nr:hypothetical protein [Cyclobacteriaceae bacterium]